MLLDWGRVAGFSGVVVIAQQKSQLSDLCGECIDPKLVVGLLLLAVGLVGYSVGVFVAFPGLSFSAAAVMIGITLIAVGERPDGDAQ